MEETPVTDLAFVEFLRQGRLMGTRCTACGVISLPPRGICARCGAAQAEWVEMPKGGKLAAFTSIYVPASKPAAEGYGREKPYVVGVVELENGLRISARIVGVDAGRPEEIRIGLPVEFEAGEMLVFRAK